MDHSLFALLASSPSAMPVSEAQAIAARVFGLECTATPLTSERDQNFHLAVHDGRELVLKIANPAEDATVVDLQTRALLHVEEHAPDLPVSRVVRTPDGNTNVAIHAHDGRACVARVLTYLPGTTCNSITTHPALRRNIACLLARLDLALSSFFHPAAGRELLWDIKHAARLRNLVSHVADSDRRAMVEHVLDNFETHVAGSLTALRTQVIYNDLNPSNVLVDPADTERITGIIDFGDLVRSPLVIDVAVAAAYQLSHAGDPLDTAAAFVAAYQVVNPLTDAELELLFDLILARLVTTVVITEWRAARYPSNRTYILRNNPTAWVMLEKLRRVSRADAADRFRQACAA